MGCRGSFQYLLTAATPVAPSCQTLRRNPVHVSYLEHLSGEADVERKLLMYW